MPRGSTTYPLRPDPGGVREDLNPIAIPDGQLLASLNWLVRRGVGAPRPGYTQVGSQVTAADRIIGIGYRNGPLETSGIVFHTLSAAYSWNGTALTAITGTWSADSDSNYDLVRMVPFRSSGTLYLLRVNPDNDVETWDGSSSAFANIGSNEPTGTDIFVLGNRVLVVYADGDQHAVQWSNFNDVSTWTATDIVRLLDTPGKLVAGRAVTPLTGAIYKNDGVYLATVQSAKTPFQFQFVGSVPGPLSPGCLVSTRGTHYWLAEDFVLYSFDGSRIQPVSSGLASTLFDKLDITKLKQTHGCVMAQDAGELWFFYPDADNAGTMTRGLSYNLATGAMNPHEFAHQVTASNSWVKQATITIDGLTSYSSTIDDLSPTFSTIDSMTSSGTASALIGDNNGNFYQFGLATTDNNTAIDWSFTHPPKAVAGLDKRVQLDGVVSYWTLTSGSVSVTLTITVSDDLGDDETTTTGTFNTNTESNHLTNFSGRAKWIKVQHSAAASNPSLEHRGAAILGWPRTMV